LRIGAAGDVDRGVRRADIHAARRITTAIG
jgi:hypothetical protein